MNHKQKLRLRNRLNLQRQKEGNHPIYVRIYVDGKKTEIFTDYWIKKVDWDNNRKLVKSSNKKADVINAFSSTTQAVGKTHIVLSMTGVNDHTKSPLNLSLAANQSTTIIQNTMEKYSKPFQTTVGHGTSELETNHSIVRALELNSAVLGK